MNTKKIHFLIVILLLPPLVWASIKYFVIRRSPSPAEAVIVGTKIKVVDLGGQKVISEMQIRSIDAVGTNEKLVVFDDARISFKYIGINAGEFSDLSVWEHSANSAKRGEIDVEPLLYTDDDKYFYVYSNNDIKVMLICNNDSSRIRGRAWGLADKAKHTCGIESESKTSLDVMTIISGVIEARDQSVW
jgi:hypothetical protein